MTARNPRNPRIRRISALAVGTALLLGGTVACGSDGKAKTTGGAKDSKSFTYWSMWKDGEPQAKVLQAAIDQFTKDTGIKVDVQWKGRQVTQQLAPTLNTNNVPADLVDAQDRFIESSLAVTKQAEDLTPLLNQPVPGEPGATVGSVVPEKYRKSLVADGKLWMVPYSVATTQVFYNAAALPDVAANPPKTWDEFTKLVADRKAANGGKGPIALDGDIADYNAYWTYAAALRSLGPGAFGDAAADKSGAKFTDPKFVDAMKKLEPLIKGGDFVDGYNGSKFPAIQQKWAAGEADFLLMGTWAPSETGPSAKAGFQYRSFPLPGATAGGEQAQDIALFGFGVPSKAKHKDAAQKFIAYFLNKERISGLSAQAKNITVRTDVPAPAELADAQKALDANPAVVTLDGVKNTKAEWYTKVFQPANNAFITGRSSAEDFTSKLKSDSAAFWKLQG